MAFCSKCGKKLDEDERFCSECGTQIVEVKDAGGNSKKPFFILAGIVAVLMLLILVSSRSTCDCCGKTFFGSGYYDIMEEYETLCEDCARDYYSLTPYQMYKK